MTPATTEQLADALERTGRLIAGIRPDQWNLPTPCTEWDVRALVDHLVNGNTVYARALGAEIAPTSEYDPSAAAVLHAFRQPDAMSRVVQVPFGRVPGAVALHLRLTELLVHGWDVARATGQQTDFPEALAEQELEFSRGALGSIPPDRSPFAPSRPAADTAPALDRLVACLGRAVD